MDINTIKNLINAGFITQVVDPNALAEKSVEELMEMGLITQVVDKDELETAVTCEPEKHCDTCTCDETPTGRRVTEASETAGIWMPTVL